MKWLIILLLTGCSETCYYGDTVFLGDSLTARWHIEGKAHKIAGIQYIGFPGATIEEIQAECVHANTIILQVGSNNIADGEDAATVASKINGFKATGKIVLVGLFTGKGYLADVMAETNSYLTPDITVDINQDDLWDIAHLNEGGYRKWKEAYLEYLATNPESI